jgi:hypothetical protein
MQSTRIRLHLLLSWFAIVTVVACRSPEPTAPAASAASAASDGAPPFAAMLAVVDKALAARPDDGVLLYQRATLAIPLGLTAADALPFLERLDATGWDVPLAASDFDPLVNDARYRELAARIEARSARVQRSTVAFTVPGKDLIPEGITVDPTTGTFFLSSIRKRKIVAIDRATRARSCPSSATASWESSA